MNTPTLETKRLRLRKFNEEDIEALFLIYQDKEVNTYLPWFPVTSLEETRALFKTKYKRVYRQSNGYHYAICLKTDNIPIGYVHVDINDSHDFGYGLRKEFWHKGIVSEACKAVLLQLKKDHFSYITATHDIKNIRSGKVMKNLGMSYQYSYEEMWQPKNLLVTFRMYQLNFDKQSNYVYQKYWNQSKVHFIEEDV